jgi:hypothetical protein
MPNKNVLDPSMNNLLAENIPIIKPFRTSALSSITDPNGLVNILSGEVKKLVCSHKSPLVSIQWIPVQFEVEKRGLHHTNANKSKELTSI